MSIEGSVAPGYETVRDAFAEVIEQQPGTGAALAVSLEGEWIVDLWGGWADAARTREWQRDSIVMPYSVSKPFAAMCVLMLVDRGLIELDAPMQRYWPELTAPASVRQVLSHQAGIVAIAEPAETEVFYDWERMCALLAAQEPEWEPGTAHGESALFYGHLVGELVRRVDGRLPGRFLREELELDFRFGLTPAEQARAVELTGELELPTEGDPAILDRNRRARTNPPGAFDLDGRQRRRLARCRDPGGQRARDGARRGEPVRGASRAARSSPRRCSPKRPRRRARGIDQVFGFEAAWGLGFGIEDGGDFGMGGSGGSYAGASVAGGYAIAFLTGSRGSFDRAERVENALRGCLGLPDLRLDSRLMTTAHPSPT